jgi:hypothetical protein
LSPTFSRNSRPPRLLADVTANQLRASEIARRPAEEERADKLFGLRATTTSAGSERDVRAAQKKGAAA